MNDSTVSPHWSGKSGSDRSSRLACAVKASSNDMHRCVVVSSQTTSPLAAEVLRAVRLMADVDALLLDESLAVVDQCDVVIIVARVDSAEAALGQIERWRTARPGTPLLLASVGLQASQLENFLRHGVLDLVSFPCLPQELAVRVHRALGVQATPALAGPTAPTAPTAHLPDFRLRHFIGSNPAFARQLAKLPVYAACDAGVLILGETGTGKEVCAQAVHRLSARASMPWVAVNCGAIPADLVENEMFGHAKGAFTTAHMSRPGLVSEAEGGTLFLDDIDCLPLSAQVKLLRFLQEREYRPIGSTTLRRADVRVIAASNHRLPGMVARGEFRQDLYFRLNVLVMQLPPLRERRDDVAALAMHFIRSYSKQHGRRVDGLSPLALRRLLAHDWPGNVRELQHVIERAVLLAAGPLLQAHDIEVDVDLDRPGAAAGSIDTIESFRSAKERVVRQFERGYIELALTCCHGNVTQAAEQAGKNRRAFFELMRKHEIAAAGYRREPGGPGFIRTGS